MLLDIVHHVLLGLFGQHPVIGFHLLHLVDEAVALEYVHVRGLPFLVRQVVGRHFVVVRLQTLQHRRGAQPPVLVCHTHSRVASYAGFHTLAYEAAQREFVVLAQGRVDVRHQYLPAGHSRIFLLVGMGRIVPFRTVPAVIGHQLLEAEILPIFVGVIGVVADFLVLHAPLAFAVETSDAGMVLVDDAALLRTVQGFGIFLL